MIRATALLFALTCVAADFAWAQAARLVPDLAKVPDPMAWKVSSAAAEPQEIDGKPAVRLTAAGDSANGIVGLAIPAGIAFDTGTIEVDLKGRNVRQRSFLGVAFNIVNETTFEAVYFRPFNFKADPPVDGRSVQYIAWPTHTWERLRKDQPGQFEKPVRPVPDPDGWFHARIQVMTGEIRVYVDAAGLPSLVVARLSAGGVKRPVALFVDSAEGVYANLLIAPDTP